MDNLYAALLREVVDNGLIYWEPRTDRGANAKADMIRRCELALSDQQIDTSQDRVRSNVVADIVTFPGNLRVSGVARISPNKLEVEFNRSVTDDQLINFWLAVKNVTMASARPEGWEPSDKSDFAQWEPA